jgi:hypothetical protein
MATGFGAAAARQALDFLGLFTNLFVKDGVAKVHDAIRAAMRVVILFPL